GEAGMESLSLKTSVNGAHALPESGKELTARLAAGEGVLACFEPDLDHNLRYSTQLVVLTNRRLLAPTQPANGHATTWEEWSLGGETLLRTSEDGPVGTLEVVGPDGRLAHWRFTVRHTSSARLLVQKWESERTGTPPLKSVCPACGAPVAEDERCPHCQPVQEQRPLSALFRLLRFGRRRAGMIALGFGLTLAS